MGRPVVALPAVHCGPDPGERATWRFHDRVPIQLSRSDPLIEAVQWRMWPHVQRTMASPLAPWVHTIRATPQIDELAGAEPIVFLRNTDAVVEDYNTGLRLRPRRDGEQIVYNPGTGTLFVIGDNAVAVVNPDQQLAIRDGVRVIKQLVLSSLEADGVSVLHASAFQLTDGSVAAVVGNKGAGKTSLTLAACRAGSRYVTNDRLLLTAGPHGLEVTGWSDPLRIITTIGSPKTHVSVRDYFGEDHGRVVTTSQRLSAVILPWATAVEGSGRVVEVDPEDARQEILGQVMPRRVRWIGLERPAYECPLSLDGVRVFRLSFHYETAAASIAHLTQILHG